MRIDTTQGALGTSNSTIAFVGLGIAGCVGLLVAVGLTVRWYRRRAKRRREEESRAVGRA